MSDWYLNAESHSEDYEELLALLEELAEEVYNESQEYNS